jgi:hypothetical protein
MHILLRRIERHLRLSGTPPTNFGREALRDPRFVADLRKGRQPGPSTVRRVDAYLDRLEQSQ